MITYGQPHPIQYNGIKYFGGDGLKLSDELEYEIEQLLDAEEDTLPRPSDDGLGRWKTTARGVEVHFLLEQTISTDLDGLKVVISRANGAISFIANLLPTLTPISFAARVTKWLEHQP